MNNSISRIAQSGIPAANLLLKTGSDIKYADLCSAFDTPIGVSANTCLAGELATIRPLEDAIFTLTAAGAIAAEISVELGAGGRVTAASSGTVIGRSVTSASDGQLIQVAVGVSGGGGGGSSTATSTKLSVTQASHGFVSGDVVYVNSSGVYAKAQANAEATSRPVGVVESAATDSFVLVTGGAVSLVGLTPGQQLYLSPDTAGLPTSVSPMVGDYHVPIMRAISTSQAIVEIGDAVLVVDDTVGGGTLDYAATVDIEMTAGVRTLTLQLAGNLTFTSSAHQPGGIRHVLVKGDSSSRTISVPAAWSFVGAIPTSVAASEQWLLELQSHGIEANGVIARWSEVTPGTGNVTIVTDSFSSGAAINGRTPDGVNTLGLTWAKLSTGDMTISGGRVASTNTSAGLNSGVANVELEADVQLASPQSAGSGPGLCLRTDGTLNNMIVCYISANGAGSEGGVKIRTIIGGTSTDVATGGTPSDYVAGGTHHLRAVASGTTISVYADGAASPQAQFTVTQLATLTVHGISGRGGTGEIRYWDNFILRALP